MAILASDVAALSFWELLMEKVKEILGKLLAVILLAGIVFGLFTVITVPLELSKMSEARTWPHRPGIITLSYANEKFSSGRAPWWREEICGSYLDTGQSFCIKRVRYGSFRFGGGKAQVQDEVAKYPVGRQVEVYYSPKDPRETILEPKGPWSEMATLLGLGIGFLLLPFVLWLFRRRIEPGRYPRP